MQKDLKSWCVQASKHSLSCPNFMRELTEGMNMSKLKYNLSWDDILFLDDVEVNPSVVNILNQSLLSNTGHGLDEPEGLLEARESIADFFSYETHQLSAEDVYIDHGASLAMYTLLSALLNPGDSILLPSPGFALYNTIVRSLGANPIMYTTNNGDSWGVNFSDLDSKYTTEVKYLVVINPSNASGTVFTREQCAQILGWANERKVAVISDESHQFCTFAKAFCPLASLAGEVPVFTIGGLSKMFSVPGWRIGWVLIYDKYKRCGDIRTGMNNIKSVLSHPPTFIQKAIKPILENSHLCSIDFLNRNIPRKAQLVFEIIKDVKELKMTFPEATAYCYFSLDMKDLDFKSTVHFYRKLAEEEGILVAPAEAFLSTCGFRIILQHSDSKLIHCMNTIKTYIENHRQINSDIL